MIEFRNVSKSFGATAAVKNLSLRIERGEFTVLIGGSGSGKSTTLKLINRLVEHDSGQILFGGEEIRSFEPEALRRKMGYAIQSTGLFPHWTVERNIATVPELLGWPAARIHERVTELLDLLGLAPQSYRDRYPHQLSGGQQQRVGVARALAADPELLLMDEPFGALDPLTRGALQREMARIHRSSGKTIVMVTHDIDEALGLATRIVLLERGEVLQTGTPAELLSQPAAASVTDFLGRGEVGIKLLGLQTVASRMRHDLAHAPEALAPAAAAPAVATEPPAAGAVAALTVDMSLRDALSAFVAQRLDRLPVVDGEGRGAGTLYFADLLREPG